jgi:hypothetical protein
MVRHVQLGACRKSLVRDAPLADPQATVVLITKLAFSDG